MTGSKCVRDESEMKRFLTDLPLSNRYNYEAKEQLEQILQTEANRLAHSRADTPNISEYFDIDIDPSSFKQAFLLPDSTAGLRISYNPELYLLILRMSALEHIQAAVALDRVVVEILQPMGLYLATQGYGGVNVEVGDGKLKQPDVGGSCQR
ncbi:hypothetical protein N7472_007358 [Penicillium cf. griseofulvum]|uniref:Uncharacterized protein n=1 Tax=Penicillium cf. griseofulvum TaxID=2972120 RepID=A0A9W9J225_9EURO|nr:hypothetical protein N7472_007358 [Penicillium cf. griseofulvum]KAJ5451905.1 hypothetical protein N7445_000088 [Penicillium cf. griseofulvum]